MIFFSLIVIFTYSAKISLPLLLHPVVFVLNDKHEMVFYIHVVFSTTGNSYTDTEMMYTFANNFV